jgi:hypothetical protein
MPTQRSCAGLHFHAARVFLLFLFVALNDLGWAVTYAKLSFGYLRTLTRVCSRRSYSRPEFKANRAGIGIIVAENRIHPTANMGLPFHVDGSPVHASHPVHFPDTLTYRPVGFVFHGFPLRTLVYSSNRGKDVSRLSAQTRRCVPRCGIYQPRHFGARSSPSSRSFCPREDGE